MKEKIRITSEEEKLSISKYYHMDFSKVPDEKLKILESGPCDPAKALNIIDKNLLFEAGYLPVETGYCVMEDGTGFMANLTPMPGVTAEMFDWWFAWHAMGPLRYTIWNPYDHKSATVLNYAHARCSELTYKEKYWNVTHVIEENTGGPDFETIFINFRKPSEIGYEEDKIGTSACSTLVCGNAGSIYSPNGVIVMTHFLRPTPEGSELRTRFWMGWHIINGRPVKMIPDGVRIPEIAVYNTLEHNIREFTHLANILPQVFEEEKNNF